MKTAPGKFLNVAIALVFAGTLLVAANSPVAAHSTRASMPTLRFSYLSGEGGGSWVSTLDPSQVTATDAAYIMMLVNANLVKLSPTGQVLPDLAAYWRISRNRRVYTFTLKRNARFSNGDHVTAADVKYSLTRSLAKSTLSPVALLYDGHIQGAAALNSGKTNTLSGVKVLNRRKVQIFLDKPIVYFLETLAYDTGDVLDARIVRRHPVDKGTYMTNTCTDTVGAGPFRFVCRNTGSAANHASFFPTGRTPTITLEPNPYYYGSKPHIKLSLPVIANMTINYSEFQAGGIDAVAPGAPFPSEDLAANRGNPNLLHGPSSIVDYITTNEGVAPFNNVHCRLAVAYAINRNAIDQVWHGEQPPTYAVVPRGFLGYYSGYNNPHYNPAKARAELRQCPGGIHNVQLTYQNTSSDISNEYRAVQSMLSAVGIGVTLKGLTFDGWLGIVAQPLAKTHTLITENFWQEDYPDPQDYCTNLLATGAAYNIGGFSNRLYDRLVSTAEVTANKAMRASLYRRAQHIALSQGAWISVGNQNGYGLVKPYVHGFVWAEAYGTLIPRGDNWSNVYVARH